MSRPGIMKVRAIRYLSLQYELIPEYARGVRAVCRAKGLFTTIVQVLGKGLIVSIFAGKGFMTEAQYNC